MAMLRDTIEVGVFTVNINLFEMEKRKTADEQTSFLFVMSISRTCT